MVELTRPSALRASAPLSGNCFLVGGQQPITDALSRTNLPTTFSRPMSCSGGRKARKSRSMTSLAQGDARLPRHSVAPCLVGAVRNMALGRETTVQGTDGPVLLGLTGAITCGYGHNVGVLAVASVMSAEAEISRRVTGVRGCCVYGETGEHSGALGLVVTSVRTVPLDDPYDLPVRESPPRGSYGTVPLRRTSELRRSRSGLRIQVPSVVPWSAT